VFLTAEDIAKIFKSQPWFIYANRAVFGGIKLGKVVRFSRETFETIIGGLCNDSLQAIKRSAGDSIIGSTA